MVSRFSVRLQLLKSLKLYILHGQLLESDAPLAGGLWNALQGLVLLWKALSVSGLLFWPALEGLECSAGPCFNAPEGSLQTMGSDLYNCFAISGMCFLRP